MHVQAKKWMEGNKGRRLSGVVPFKTMVSAFFSHWYTKLVTIAPMMLLHNGVGYACISLAGLGVYIGSAKNGRKPILVLMEWVQKLGSWLY